MRALRLGGALFFVMLGFGVVAAVSPAAHAQDRQVAFDPNETVYRITPSLRDRLDLFPDVQGFEEAALFWVGDDAYELVIAYRRNDTRLRERRALTQEEVDALRRRVGTAMETQGIRPTHHQDGRFDLLTFTTLYGSWSGTLLAFALAEEPSDQLFLGLSGVMAAGGFFVPLYVTQNRPVTSATAEMAVYGGLQGWAHGAQVATLLGGGGVDGQAITGAMVVFGGVGLGSGYALASANEWSDGHASMVAFTGTYGNFLGLGSVVALTKEEGRERPVAGVSLLGSLAGGYLGHRLGRTGRYTRGDARVYLTGGLQGAQLALAALVARDEESPRVIAGTLSAASLAGFGVGALAVRNRDFSTYESNLVGLSSLVGSAIGGGIGAMAEASEETAIVMQALGSVAGSVITYASFAGSAHRRASRSAGLRWDWHITPTLPTAQAPDGRIRLGTRPVPKLTVTARF